MQRLGKKKGTVLNKSRGAFHRFFRRQFAWALSLTHPRYIQEDLQTVKNASSDATLRMENIPSLHLQLALVVRIGEKRVLEDVRKYTVQMLQQAEAKESEEEKNSKGRTVGAGKRKADCGEGTSGKKRRK